MFISSDTHVANRQKLIGSLGKDVCVPVSYDQGIPRAVWPIDPMNTSVENECECTLCDGSNCQLGNFSCVNETIYTITLNSDIDSSGQSNYMLCIHNLTEEMNRTYIYMYYEKPFECSRGNHELPPPFYRLYVKSYWISVGNKIKCVSFSMILTMS